MALIGEVKGVEFVPISHQVEGGSGVLRIPGMVETEMVPYRGPDGSVTTLQNSVFSERRDGPWRPVLRSAGLAAGSTAVEPSR